MNVNIIRGRKYEETNDKKLNEYTVFPRMQTAVLAGALSSGHFTDKSDPNFSTQAFTLNEILVNFNNMLRITENLMATTTNRIHIRTKVREGLARTSVIQKLLEFGVMLMSEYGNMLIKEYGEKIDDKSIEELDIIKKHIKSVKNQQKPNQ